jgi:hypothetical protein
LRNEQGDARNFAQFGDADHSLSAERVDEEIARTGCAPSLRGARRKRPRTLTGSPQSL